MPGGMSRRVHVRTPPRALAIARFIDATSADSSFYFRFATRIPPDMPKHAMPTV